MNIAIIEDEPIHRELLRSLITRWGQERARSVTIWSFASAEQFLFEWEERQFDVCLIDIEMSGMNGMELAHTIRSRSKKVALIFTTGVADYLEEGYEVEALRYLLKPLQEDKVYAALDKAAQQAGTASLLLHDMEDGTIRLDESDINYIEAMGHTARIGRAYHETVCCRESLSQIEKMLPDGEYCHCHRSYLCHLANIRRIEHDSVTFDDGSSIPVSRRLYAQLNQSFIQYFRRDTEE